MHKLHLTAVVCMTALVLGACGSDTPANDDDNDNDPATTYTLTLTAGSNGTVASSPAGSSFEAGTVLTLTATPSSGYKVASWVGTSDDSSISPVNHVTMTANKIVNVSFTAVSSATFTLTLSPGANGTINATPAGPTYADGTTVNLTAVPASGYKLASWSGTNNDSATGTTNTVTMTANKTVSATFVVAPVQKVLTLNIAQEGVSGAWGVTATPPGTLYHGNTQTISYDAGTSVTLTGVSTPAWPFRGYTGDIGGQNGAQCSITITMDIDRTITASIPLDSGGTLTDYCD